VCRVKEKVLLSFKLGINLPRVLFCLRKSALEDHLLLQPGHDIKLCMWLCKRKRGTAGEWRYLQLKGLCWQMFGQLRLAICRSHAPVGVGLWTMERAAHLAAMSVLQDESLH
jgi:hypothetical protein